MSDFESAIQRRIEQLRAERDAEYQEWLAQRLEDRAYAEEFSTFLQAAFSSPRLRFELDEIDVDDPDEIELEDEIQVIVVKSQKEIGSVYPSSSRHVFQPSSTYDAILKRIDATERDGFVLSFKQMLVEYVAQLEANSRDPE